MVSIACRAVTIMTIVKSVTNAESSIDTRNTVGRFENVLTIVNGTDGRNIVASCNL